MKQSKPKEKDHPLTIRRLDQIKALAHPLRYQIFERLVVDPASPKAVALDMGLKATRLYHHFHVLEKAGLIKRTRSQRKRGAIERTYAAAAERIIVDKDRLGGEMRPGGSLALQALHTTMQEIERSEDRARVEKRDLNLNVVRLVLRLSPQRAAELESKFDALLAEAQQEDPRAPQSEYRVTVAMYEAARRPDTGGSHETS